MNKNLLIISFGSKVISRHFLMLKSLKARGWDITFIGWDRDGNVADMESYRGVIDRLLWVELAAPVWSKKILFTLPPYFFKLWKIISNLKPDLIILTHLVLLPLAFRFRCPKIYDSFEMYALEMASYFGPLEKQVWPLWRLLEGFLVKQVNGIVTVDSRQGWLEKNFKRYNDRVQVIWNLPSTSEDPDDGKVQALEERYRGRKIAGFVGGLMKEQGLRVALAAAALVTQRHPESLFLFIGSMKDDINQVRQIISSEGLDKYVLFLPFMPYRNMLAHLWHARIGLMLYQPERVRPFTGAGNGRKSFTYMQAGIPIIAPSFGEIGGIIKREGCGILTDTTDHMAVAQAIIRLLENPEEAEAMGHRGRAAFVTKYNWNLEEKKFLDFVDEVTRPWGKTG
jgi:glycosyltransferase involved in cell wall biosynthesis